MREALKMAAVSVHQSSLQIISTDHAAKETRFESNASLVWRRDVTEDLICVRVLPDFPIPVFHPGQYAELAIIEEVPQTGSVEHPPLGRLVRKAYSIVSAPGDTQGLEFCITLVKTGDLTPKLWRLSEGDRLWMNPKIKGKFTLDSVLPSKDLLLFATGTGVAPYISMLRTFRANPPWNSVAVFYGVRNAEDLAYHDELLSLAEADSRIHYLPSVTREPWSGLHGRLTELLNSGTYENLLHRPFLPDNCQVMLCGSPAMIEEMQKIFEDRGFRLHTKKGPGQIHAERYW